METKYKIHIGYIFAILLAVIVYLSVKDFSSNPELVDYISFASTVASLILALLAIIYSFVSNNALSKNIGIINEATTNLKENSDSLDRVSKVIIHEIPNAIKEMDQKLDSTQNLVNNLGLNDENDKISPHKNSTSKLTMVQKFIDVSSLTGLFLIYAVFLANYKSLPLNIEEIAVEIGQSNDEYVWGYFVASSSAGLFDFNAKDKVCNIKTIHSEIKKDDLIEKISLRGKEIERKIKADNPDSSYSWKNKFEAIEKYFED